MALVLVSTLVALNRSDVAHEREQSATFAALALTQLESATVSAQSGVRGFVITGQERFLDAYRDALDHLPGVVRDFELTSAGQVTDRAAFKSVETRVRRFFDDFAAPAIAIARRDRAQAASFIADGTSKREVDAIKQQIGELLQRSRVRASEASSDARQSAALATWLAIAGMSLTIVLFIALVVFAARKVARPIEQIADAAQKLQGGDYSARAPATLRSSSRETATLAEAFNAMAISLDRAYDTLSEYNQELEAQQESLHEAHRLLLEREQLLDAMVASSTSAVGVVEGVTMPVANDRLRDLIASHGLEDVVGHPEQIPGETTRDYVELETGEGARTFLRTLTPVVVAGEPTQATLVALQDMTDEHDIEQMRDEFFKVVSHELRSPLTAVKGYVAAIEELEHHDAAADDEIAKLRRRDVEVLTRNVAQLDRLVSDILTVTHIESGQLSMRFDEDPLAPVVEDAVENARPHAAEHGIELNVRLLSQPVVSMDKGRVGQVIDNLLSNALKFTAAGGKVDVVLTASEYEAEIRVTDTGPGIARDEIKHLFDRFYRSKRSGERLVEGLGLGLTIVKAIVSEHGGEIDVESELGKGTTFRVKLPVVALVKRKAVA